MKKVVVGIAGGLFLAYLLVPKYPDPMTPAPAASSATPESDPRLEWKYEQRTDPMTGRTYRIAGRMSTNEVELKFPYQGKQHGLLVLRKGREAGQEVIFKIERGQLQCWIEDCNVRVRFDNGPVQAYSASGPSDHSTETLFLDNPDSFVRQLRNSKALTLEVLTFQNGRQIFHFATSNLKW